MNGDAQRIKQHGWILFFKFFSDKDQELELLDDNCKLPIPAEKKDIWKRSTTRNRSFIRSRGSLLG